MKKARVISAFPGTGKTYLVEHNNTGLEILDSDSSKFHWLESGSLNTEWPTNYIRHIKDNSDKVDLILVSSHKDVRDALIEAGIDFEIIIPKKSTKQEYLKKYENRGSSETFRKLLEDKWDTWISEILMDRRLFVIELESGETISEYMNS